MQVSNLADSIKIATDYVSPENIDRCTKLTKEFREQNKSKVWKEDILQLKTMMWFAWQSCSRQEKRLREEGQDRTYDSSSSREGPDSLHGRSRANTVSSQSGSSSTPRSTGK
jgi:lysine-specific demethylase 3